MCARSTLMKDGSQFALAHTFPMDETEASCFKGMLIVVPF
jgi:hypothetical protein